jgi:hypothetical protein
MTGLLEKEDEKRIIAENTKLKYRINILMRNLKPDEPDKKTEGKKH